MTARVLARLKTAEEIEEMLAQVLTAHLASVSVLIHINQSSDPSGMSDAGISLSTPESREQFMADCEAALASKNGDTPGLPSSIDFSQRQIEV